MLANPADQLRLLDLAGLDAQIAQNEHTAQHLPELAALKELGGQRRLIDEELVAAQTRLSDAEADQERVEADLRPARARLERDQSRVDDGSITDPKALRGLLDEIEHLSGRITKLEDDELEVMQVIEDLAGERAAIAERRDQINQRARGLIGKRDEALAQLTAAHTDLVTERDQLAATFAAELIADYEGLRTKRGSGAAALEQGRCTGCRLEVNDADLRVFRKAPPAEVLHCEECGRILVRTTTSF